MRKNLPPTLRHSVQQLKQQYSWDCGLTCIQMLLDEAQRVRFVRDFRAICIAEGFGNSTWTIDLCYVLRKFHVAHVFCTTTAGVAHAHRTCTFYARVFCRDVERVNRRFRDASAMGINVRVRSVPLDGVLQQLRHGPAIVLTDATLLRCAICPQMAHASSFIGHYVVLCGYEMHTQRVFYRNPSVVDDHLCSMSFRAFDAARKAAGTDEDIIFINMPKEDCKSLN